MNSMSTSKDYSQLVSEKRWDLLVHEIKSREEKGLSPQQKRLLAISYLQLGFFSDAETWLTVAIEENSSDASLRINQGLCYFKMGKFRKALDAFDQALRLDSDSRPARLNRALILEKLERFKEAKSVYTELIERGDTSAEMYFNFGNLCMAMADYGSANRAFESALTLNPDNANIWYSLGNTWAILSKNSKAIDAYQACLRLDSNHVRAMQSLGALLLEIGDPKLAREILKRAASFDTSSAGVFNNLGLAYQRTNNFAKALKNFKLALSVDPRLRVAWSQLQNLRTLICDESVFMDEEVVSGDIWGGAAPFTFFVLEDNPGRQLLRSEDFADVHLKRHVPPDRPLWKSPDDNRLVLGFFSADFKGHATTYLISGLLRNLDRSKFKVILFNYSLGSDEATESLKLIADEFIEVAHYADSAIAELSRQKGVQIAFDLKGYTENSRPKIFAFRAAPVQINYLGYPGTLGAPWIDYIIADRFIIPPSDQRFYGEKVVYMPHCYQPTDNTRIIDTTKQSKADHGLPESGTVFCSFNQNYKITPVEIDVWSRILREVPNSVLWLFESNRWSKTNLIRAFVAKGVNRDRLIFCSQVEQSLHLARYQLADIFLDCFKVNAHTTASDALWMGVPLITLSGKQFASRVAGSLLRSLGVEELIQTSVDSYVKTAVRLAIDDNELQQLKRKIVNRTKTAPLFDTKLYTRDFEDLLMKIFDKRLND